MPHPCDDRRFGPLLHRNPFRSGNCAATYWRGVISNNLGEAMRKVGMVGMKRQEVHHGFREVFDIRLLGLLPSLGVSIFAFGKALR